MVRCGREEKGEEEKGRTRGNRCGGAYYNVVEGNRR
jgi:hypothetical protein